MGELVPNRMTPHLHRVHHRHHCPRYQEQGSESGFRSKIMDLDHKSGSRIELQDQGSKIIIKNHVTTPIAFCISNFVALLCIQMFRQLRARIHSGAKSVAIPTCPLNALLDVQLSNFGLSLSRLKQSWKMSRIWRIYPCKKMEGLGNRIYSFAKSSIALSKFQQLI